MVILLKANILFLGENDHRITELEEDQQQALMKSNYIKRGRGYRWVPIKENSRASLGVLSGTTWLNQVVPSRQPESIKLC